MGIAMRRWFTRMPSRLHFIEADLREDWLASIDWDAVVRSILVRAG